MCNSSHLQRSVRTDNSEANMHQGDSRVKSTSQALSHVERARSSIKSVQTGNVSTDGVFFNPQMTLVSLKVAREELNKAIALMERTRWTK